MKFLLCGLLLLTAGISYSFAQAIVVFSFAGRNWAPNGTLSESFNNVGGGTINFNVTGSTGSMIDFSGGPTPDIFTDTFGGLGVNNSALVLAMNQGSSANTVTTSITFSHSNGVRNVNFSVFDIDRGNTTGSNYQDQITVRAYRFGNLINSSLVTVPSHGSSNSVAGNVVTGNLSVNDTGTGSGLGNATFQIESSTVIDRIDIIYGNGPLAPSNPTQQWIMLSDITFTVAIPEPSTWFLLIGTPLCLGSIWFLRYRNKLEADNQQAAEAKPEDAMPVSSCKI
ncbi:MAG: hypothetical protein JNJ77_05450 [Planctomycetia bacterium]|nr:hypothetical protein [Planctomycetia bacterium]